MEAWLGLPLEGEDDRSRPHRLESPSLTDSPVKGLGLAYTNALQFLSHS